MKRTRKNFKRRLRERVEQHLTQAQRRKLTLREERKARRRFEVVTGRRQYTPTPSKEEPCESVASTSPMDQQASKSGIHVTASNEMKTTPDLASLGELSASSPPEHLVVNNGEQNEM